MPTRTRDAEFLKRWQTRTGLRDRECAEWCRLSVSAWRRQRSGKISAARMRQTIRLVELHEIVSVSWLDVAEAATKAARLIKNQPSIR